MEVIVSFDGGEGVKMTEIFCAEQRILPGCQGTWAPQTKCV